MRTRPMELKDIPTIKAMHEASGYDFELPDLTTVEDATVVLDENGEIGAFGYAVKIVEVSLVMQKKSHPLLKMMWLKLLHQQMCNNLVRKGYREALAHVPPEIERNYGRHLMRRFGWLASWPGFRIKDWTN